MQSLAGRLLLVGALLAAAVLAPSSASAAMTPCSLPGPLSGGASLASTLSVTEADGTTVVTADGTGYQACITPNGSEAYSIVIAKSDNSEDLGALNADRIFTLGFTLPSGSATSAELYANVRSYTIGVNQRDITLVMSPVSITSIAHGHENDEDPPAAQDSLARITGGIRFTPTGAPGHGITGMWIGADAASYAVEMGGSCPNFDSGAASGSTTPGSLSVRMSGPHLTAGTLGAVTVNTGSLRAFIPGSVASACFGGLAPAAIVTQLTATRTEAGGGETALALGTQFTIQVQDGGLLIDVPRVTFSRPTYRFAMPAAATAAAAAPVKASTTPGKAATATATGTRAGARARIAVTVPAASAGKKLVISVKVGKRYVVRSTSKAKAGTSTLAVSLKGVKGKAAIRVALDGAVIATLRL